MIVREYAERDQKVFELIAVVIFVWLLVKALGLYFRMTWGIAKVAAAILIGLALPMLIFCLLFAGGIVLLAPLLVITLAAGLVKACL